MYEWKKMNNKIHNVGMIWNWIHLDTIIDSHIATPIIVGHVDVQRKRSFACQLVKLVQADPSLSWKIFNQCMAMSLCTKTHRWLKIPLGTQKKICQINLPGFRPVCVPTWQLKKQRKCHNLKPSTSHLLGFVLNCCVVSSINGGGDDCTALIISIPLLNSSSSLFCSSLRRVLSALSCSISFVLCLTRCVL